jgi:O-antigen ligase
MKTVSKNEQNRFVFYGLLVYLFLFYAQPAGRYPALAPLRLELILGIILLLIALKKILTGQIDLKENSFNSVAVLFFFFLIVTIPFAFVKTRALDSAVRIFKFFAIYLMIISIVNNEKQLKTFIYVYLSLICLIFMEPLLTSNFIYNNHMMRLAGITNYFAHPNQLGMIASSHLPFFYYLMLHEKSKKIKILCFALIICAVRVVMLTQSRTAMVGILMCGFIIWLYSSKKVLMLAAGFLSVIILWQTMPQESKDRFLTLTQSSRVISSGRSTFTADEGRTLGSMASRWELTKHAWRVFIENPIIGVGTNCFISYSGRRWHSWFPPHNTYLQALAEFGIIGFSIMLSLIFYTLKNLYHAKRILIEIGREDTFIFAIITPIIGYYLIFLTVSIFGIEIFSNFWWFIGGLSVVILKLAKSQYQEHIKLAQDSIIDKN